MIAATRVGHVMTAGELKASLARVPDSAIVVVERSASGALKAMTVGEAYPRRVQQKSGRMKTEYFVIMPTSVSDAVHKSLAK